MLSFFKYSHLVITNDFFFLDFSIYIFVHVLQIISRKAFLSFPLFVFCRNIWQRCSGSVNRLQQCDICWRCWSKTLHAGWSANRRHNASNFSPCMVSVWLIAFVFVCRCALNARKLEFMYIWRTAMVRPMYQNYFCPNGSLCYILCLYLMESFS